MTARLNSLRANHSNGEVNSIGFIRGLNISIFIVRFTSVTKRLPKSVVSLAKDTSLQRAYEWTRLHIGDLEMVQIEYESREFEVLLPKASYIYETSMNPGEGYEPKLRSRLSKVLSDDSVFYDIGAAYGYFSSLAVACGVPADNVHAFEANWFRSQILMRTHGDESVHIQPSYVGAETGPNSVTVDDYASTHRPPTVIKMDVEGAESDVLAGMDRVLRENRPVLYIECHPEKIQGGVEALDEYIDLFQELDYDLTLLNHRTSDSSEFDELPSAGNYLLEALPE